MLPGETRLLPGALGTTLRDCACFWRKGSARALETHIDIVCDYTGLYPQNAEEVGLKGLDSKGLDSKGLDLTDCGSEAGSYLRPIDFFVSLNSRLGSNKEEEEEEFCSPRGWISRILTSAGNSERRARLCARPPSRISQSP